MNCRSSKNRDKAYIKVNVKHNEHRLITTN
jgi:hypothetical protein